MLESLSTNATAAKAKAFYGRRLRENDYKELLMRSSVQDVAEYLKTSTHYKTAFENVDTHTIHRGHLESLLKRDKFVQYARLCRFQGLHKISFYTYVIKSMEVDEIVKSVLHINAGETDEYITRMPVYLMEHASFDLMALAKANSYGEILDAVKKSGYYDCIKNFTPDENGRYDCSAIETALRRHYLEWLSGTVDECFSGKAAKELHGIIRKQYELINIINGFRYKAFSGADADEIEKIMLPTDGGHKNKKLRYLLESKDAKEYAERMMHSGFSRLDTNGDGVLEISEMEMGMSNIRVEYAKRGMRSTNSASVCLYSILFLNEIEVANIISIIEGIRYKVPAEMIQERLIY